MRMKSPQSPPSHTGCVDSALGTGVVPREFQLIVGQGEVIDCYAHRIVKHLTQGLQEMPDEAAARLSQLRQLALRQRKVS